MRSLPVLALTILTIVCIGGAASAQPRKPPQAEPPTKPDAEQPKPVGDEFAVPAPSTSVAESVEEEQGKKDLYYGVAARTRWVSVPGWLLGIFTAKNVPLSSYHAGLELFRRKGELDFVLGFSFQDMSPPDGNWLGKGKDPAIDTDFVQFKGLGMVGVDAAFIWRKLFNPYVGVHYGAGIGLAVITGKILRTASAGCTDSTLGDLSTCHPARVECNANGCNETQLKGTEAAGGRAVDSASTPSRFQDENAPPVIPIVNVLVGLDFHIPDVKGIELRLEGGFFDAFFLGGAVGYAF